MNAENKQAMRYGKNTPDIVKETYFQFTVVNKHGTSSQQDSTIVFIMIS